MAVGLVLALCAFGGYWGARESSAFAIRTIDVRGVSPAVAVDVRAALEPLVGTSLIVLRPQDVNRLVLALPEIASVRYDRAFPNALVLRVEAERPVAVARSGTEGWLVSTNGRVLERVPRGAHRRLARLWLPADVDVRVGSTLAAGGGAAEVAALLPVAGAGLAGRVTTVRVARGRVTYKLRNGVELRAGRLANLRLKLAISARILEQNAVREYLDVSVPARPVGILDPQLSG